MESIVIQAPPNDGSSYYNYKNSHSVVLLAVRDAHYRFTLVDTGDAGGQSDRGVFSNSGSGMINCSFHNVNHLNVIHYTKAAIVLHNYFRSTESTVYCPPGYVDGEDGVGNMIPGNRRMLDLTPLACICCTRKRIF